MPPIQTDPAPGLRTSSKLPPYICPRSTEATQTRPQAGHSPNRPARSSLQGRRSTARREAQMLWPERSMWEPVRSKRQPVAPSQSSRRSTWLPWQRWDLPLRSIWILTSMPSRYSDGTGHAMALPTALFRRPPQSSTEKRQKPELPDPPPPLTRPPIRSQAARTAVGP